MTAFPALPLLATGWHNAKTHAQDIAFDIANSETCGFRGRHTITHPFFASFQQQSGQPADTLPHKGVTYPIYNQTHVKSTNGALERTNNPLNVALSGQGFFALHNGTFTRNGQLCVSPEGILQTADGVPYQSTRGEVIRLDENVESILITRQGRILSPNGTLQGVLAVRAFHNNDTLQRLGDNAWGATTDAGYPDTNTQVLQGHLEKSNVSTPKMMAEMSQVHTQGTHATSMMRTLIQTTHSITPQLLVAS